MKTAIALILILTASANAAEDKALIKKELLSYHREFNEARKRLAADKAVQSSFTAITEINYKIQAIHLKAGRATGKVTEGAHSVSFKLKLTAGHYDLKTRLLDGDIEFGALYLDIRTSR